MRVQFALWTGIVLLIAGTGAAINAFQGAVSAAVVDTQRHYRAEVSVNNANTAQMIQNAQEHGFWIRIQTNTDITYFNGDEPCNACDPSQESLFMESPILYVDGSDFRIRIDEEEWKLSLRPRTSEMPNAYELIISPILPKTELNAEDRQAIDTLLSPLGILTMPVSALTLTEYFPPAKAAPPEGARIDSELYAITLAPDWDSYAAQHNIGLSGLRAEVLIEIESEDFTFPGSVDVVVESQSTNFVRAQVLIHELVDVASLEGVTFVRLPSAPQPPAAQ